MQTTIELENIEEMRLQEGIDDVELRTEIRGLRAGDLVKLTFVTGPASFETLPVRITRITGTTFRGELARKPSSNRLAGMGAGSPLTFGAVHIHSIAKRTAQGV